jgi:predicted O-methyltransferase YrrM
MSTKTFTLPEELHNYLLKVSVQEPGFLKRLRAETATLPDSTARMQISPEQGQFMALLVQLIGAKKALEIGVFTGYSSTCVARALPADGKIVACDINREWTSIARKYWKEAGVDDKIDLRLGDAVKTLDALIVAGQEGTFDFAFIDADKKNYQNYFERALQLLRPRGVITVDNVLWSGRVADPSNQEPDTIAIRNFNEALAHDRRVDISLIPIGDGLTLAMKRP